MKKMLESKLFKILLVVFGVLLIILLALYFYDNQYKSNAKKVKRYLEGMEYECKLNYDYDFDAKMYQCELEDTNDIEHKYLIGWSYKLGIFGKKNSTMKNNLIYYVYEDDDVTFDLETTHFRGNYNYIALEYVKEHEGSRSICFYTYDGQSENGGFDYDNRAVMDSRTIYLDKEKQELCKDYLNVVNSSLDEFRNIYKETELDLLK